MAVSRGLNKCLLEKYHKYLAAVFQMVFVFFRFVNNQRDFLVYIMRYTFVGTFRSSQQSCSIKKVLIKFRKIYRKTLVSESLFNKKDSDTGVFQLILRNF